MNQICPLPPASLATLLTPRTVPLFIAGTDTEIGKTFVGSLIAAQLLSLGKNVGVYKPLASGCEPDENGVLVSEDALRLWTAAGQPETLEAVCPQRFRAPLAPCTAAKLEGREVNRQQMLSGAHWWLQRSDLLLVEGAGGLMSPLDDDYFNADLARDLSADVIIIAADKLGVIHHTLTTLIAAKSYGLNVLGVILNRVHQNLDPSIHSNAEAIRHYADVPLLSIIDFQPTANHTH